MIPGILIASFADVGVDGFLLRRGLAQFALKEFAGRGAFVQRVTARTGLATGEEGESMIAGRRTGDAKRCRRSL